LDQSSDKRAAVLRVGVQVARRIDLRAGRLCRRGDRGLVDHPAVQHGLARRQPVRPAACTDNRDMRIAGMPIRIFVIEQRRAGEGEIAMPAGKFAKRPAALGRPRRQPQFGDQFALAQPGRKRSGEEPGRRNNPLTRLAGNHNLAVASHRDPGQFGRRIGMGEAAADRAAVANLVMRDMRDRLPQQRVRRGEPRVGLDVAPRHPGAEPDTLRTDGDAPQPGKPPQIDQKGRGRQAEIQYRHQALAAGDRHRPRLRLQEGEGGFESFGRLVFKTSGLHAGLGLPARRLIRTNSDLACNGAPTGNDSRDAKSR
jgi:hypothetical protein